MELPDAYISVTEALNHAGIANDAKVNVEWINAERLENPDEDLTEVFFGVKGIGCLLKSMPALLFAQPVKSNIENNKTSILFFIFFKLLNFLFNTLFCCIITVMS